jgi:type IV pilus assembly protein PilE
MKKGFTLIELLVVVIIIAVLTAVALPLYRKAVTKAKYTEMVILVKALGEAREHYELVNGHVSSLNKAPSDFVVSETAPGHWQYKRLGEF